MISSITSLWPAIATPLANHLWQSTLFAAAAGLLTLVLSKNQARVRYWLWLSASIKFLVPFSFLVSLGTWLSPAKANASGPSGVFLVIEQIGVPFAPATQSAQAVPSAATAGGAHIVSFLLVLAWIAGSLALLTIWMVRWRRLNAAISGNSVSTGGREFETLQRLTQRAGVSSRIELVLSESTLEPGILGISHPVMVLPERISERLSDSQLEAIIAHELCHIRRRDNLAAALHMLVEALFWFHPLVWWTGARLVDERERACDEAVLAAGSEPQAYAEGILKICEFYMESPLLLVPGVTGSNLKKRIEAIMIHRIARKLETGKKLLLAVFGFAAITAPITFGLLHPVAIKAQEQAASGAPLAIESATITPNKTGEAMPPFHIVSDPPGTGVGIMYKPDQVMVTNATLHFLVRTFYGLRDSQVSGGPGWVNSERYNVIIKFNRASGDKLSDADREQRTFLLRDWLASRFNLKVRHEQNQMEVYELVVGRDGSKLTEVHPQPGQLGRMSLGLNPTVAEAVTIDSLRGMLESRVGRMVIDRTGLNGVYDFTFNAPEEGRPVKDAPALLKAVSEQLGLELSPVTKSMETLVIDYAEPLAPEQK